MSPTTLSEHGGPPGWPIQVLIRLDALMEVTKDGQTWLIGTGAEIAWIVSGTTVDTTITAAIPPVFAAYATFHELDQSRVAGQESVVVRHLANRSGDQSWWLGFLDTGAHDVVFEDVPKVTLYTGWHYVLVEAGPSQALSWRIGHMRAPYGYGALPDLIFPADRSWLVSALWDDTWTCVGGPAELIAELQQDPDVRARVVRLHEDATPPGHESL